MLSRFDILRTGYIKVLNDKDVLLNWGKPQLEALYATRVGAYQIDQLKLELNIKALKRKIELVRSLQVHNLPVNVEEIESKVQEELMAAELAIMQETLKIKKGELLLSNLDTPQRSVELRQLFKQLAKLLHPDVNPDLTEEQSAIWHKVKDAYETGDLERLKALQLTYESEILSSDERLEQLTEEQILLRIETMREGAKLIEKQIETIRSEFPFDIEHQIKDDLWVKEKQEAILQQIKNLRAYEGELILEYQALIINYGGTRPELN